MASLRHKGMNLTVWALMGLLIFGLAGFGLENFGGSATTAIRVDGREVSANDYARALDQQMRTFSAQIGRPVTLSEAESIGLDRAVRSQLVARAVLDGEVERIGVSVGDARLQEEILAIPAFRGFDGRFDRAAYRDQIARLGLSEPAFERSLREDAARGLLEVAVASGATAPEAFTRTLLSHIAETRDATHLTLREADLPEPLPEADEAALRAFHAAHLAEFTRPEARRIAYAWATPSMLAAGQPVDETALRAAYEARIEDYVQPERRLVERLAFGSEEEAARVRADLDAGRITFDGLLAERRLTLADIDLGDVDERDLGAAGPGVFALTAPGIVGPLPSDFGPALYRMNGILAAQEITFEEARADLQQELGLDAARRALSGRTEAIDDLLAGGASIEEVAGETELELGTIDWHESDEEGISAYPEFRAAAAAVQEGDFPELVALGDGGLLTLRLDGIVPAAAIPFEEARDEVAAAWRREELAARLAAFGETLLGRIGAGEAIDALGLPADAAIGLTREMRITDLPESFAEALFAMREGETRLLPEGDALVLLRLDRVSPPDMSDPRLTALRASIDEQVAQSIGSDIFQYFAAALQRAADVRFNESTMTAVHSQFQR